MADEAVYVVLRDYPNEGLGAPIIAFRDREEAVHWAFSRNKRQWTNGDRASLFEVYRVPVHPEPPADEYKRSVELPPLSPREFPAIPRRENPRPWRADELSVEEDAALRRILGTANG